jgi:GT2 family glycosyltransferase
VRPSVSVILVSYQSRDVLEPCLVSLAECARRVPLEVIVVDNDSRDGTVQWLEREHPEVRVIANPHNRGFASAVNQGLEIAVSDDLLLLNPDSLVDADGLERLRATLASDLSCAVAAPMLLDDDGTPARSCGRFPNLWTLACEHLWLSRFFPRAAWAAGYKYAGVPLESLDVVGWASGAALLIPRRALRMVGGLDAGYFMYMEEVDWCLRATQQGWRVRYVPTAVFTHTGQHASKGSEGRTYLHNLRSRVRYFRKHHGAVAATVAKAILLMSLVLKWTSTRLGARGAEASTVYVRGLEAVWAA